MLSTYQFNSSLFWWQVAQQLVGNFNHHRSFEFTPRTVLPAAARSAEEKKIMAIWDSCPFKAALSCAAGGHCLVF